MQQAVELLFELSNYRCFPDEVAASVTVRPGFTSFVGVNNAGKSSLLRSFYELRQMFVELSQPQPGLWLAGNPNYGAPRLQLSGVPDPTEVFSDSNDRPMRLAFGLRGTPLVERRSGQLIPKQVEFHVARRTLTVKTTITLEDGTATKASGWVNVGSENFLQLQNGIRVDTQAYAEAFDVLARSVYLGAFRNALNVGSGNPYYDLAVGQQFIAQWDQLKSGANKLQRRGAVAVENEIGSVFGIERLQLNASNDNQTLLATVGSDTYSLNEMGSGFAQFVIVLAYVATRDPALILIDEPEANLHPALQLEFLTTLGQLCSYGVLYSTHSLGLARAGADRTYSLRRLSQGKSQIRLLEGTPNLAEFLGELSFSGYQELGYTAVLLVEGPSELRAVRQFLRLYGAEKRIVLVPMGGDVMIKTDVEMELAEVKRLTSSVFALIDSERDAPEAPLAENRAGFVDACVAASVTCHVLERRALENYFTERAVRDALGTNAVALGPYDAVVPWRKTKDNWRIAERRRPAASLMRLTSDSSLARSRQYGIRALAA